MAKVFDIEVSGNLERALRRVVTSAKDMRPAWRIIGLDLVRSMQQNFAVSGRPDKWKPLAASTLMGRVGGVRKMFTKRGKVRKAAGRKIAGHKILVRSSRLLNSITYRLDRDGVEVGTNLEYGAIHQYGGKAGRGKEVEIPARPYLVIQPSDDRQMAKTIEKHLTRFWR